MPYSSSSIHTKKIEIKSLRRLDICSCFSSRCRSDSGCSFIAETATGLTPLFPTSRIFFYSRD
jgi:hypothetical protein